MGKMLTRQEAWELLTRYTKTPSLQKHALAVEAVMKYFAKLNNEDVEKWGVVGLPNASVKPLNLFMGI